MIDKSNSSNKSGDIKDLKSIKKERQRKFLIVLPLVVIPFMTLLFWSTGIVGSVDAQSVKGAANRKSGFNFQLPVARQASDSNWNKMQYYEKADKDSERMRSLIRAAEASEVGETQDISGMAMPLDPKEKAIEEKIAAIHKRLQAPPTAMDDVNPENSSYANELPDPPPAEKAAALRRIRETARWAAGGSLPEEMAGAEALETASVDPELEKLDGMLTKVLDIQHPERVKKEIRQRSEQNKKLVYPVRKKERTVTVSLLNGHPEQKRSGGFYGLNGSDPTDSTSIRINTIPAEIPEEQVLVNGATVKLQLLSDVHIHGVPVAKNQPLYGVAALKGERLEILVHSIGYQGRILPVALSAYDLDGQQGLFIPGAISRDIAKRSAGQAVETLNFGAYGATLGAQAASAGIQAAGRLIGKKVQLVKVRVRSGYRLWLKDLNIKENE
ncbi:conjugative transposon protein TraM [Arachidicoccus terrestris]|uniref:conjugative transposon protein TraM n=1 Tax=Arachidicoccus terrestris TaxID=2875539 RepID=UPI001CC43D2D|nr:conjugative transposon protein TraM [Arachidicoccus terrestris]UAY55775.1 conjugative transposon protein TraM [Arachidicoccus terrestris]